MKTRALAATAALVAFAGSAPALAATHILRSKITRFGSKCVLNGELIDLRSEVAVAAASSRGDCVAEGFLNMSEEVAVAITAQ